jgi:mutator protein MutT
MKAAGLWEFPGGKVEPGESEPEALARELREELAVECRIGACLGLGTAPLSAASGLQEHLRTIHLSVYLAELVDGEPMPIEHDQLRWLGPEELESVTWAPADIPLLEPLRTLLRSRS